MMTTEGMAVDLTGLFCGHCDHPLLHWFPIHIAGLSGVVGGVLQGEIPNIPHYREEQMLQRDDENQVGIGTVNKMEKNERPDEKWSAPAVASGIEIEDFHD